MANLGQELASLDFANLIGGPLNAIVDAQAKSAIATANFVRDVGFDKEGNIRNTTFRYSRPNEEGTQEEFALTIPFIAMLPIPYIQIEQGEVEFNAKLTSTQETTNNEEIAAGMEAEVTANWFVKAKIKASASYKKTSSATEKVERTFDMRVKVVVRGTDLPTGTERLLSILENSLSERPTGNLTATLVVTEDAAKSGTVLTVESVEPLNGEAKGTLLLPTADGKTQKLAFTAVDTATNKITVAALPEAVKAGTQVSASMAKKKAIA